MEVRKAKVYFMKYTFKFLNAYFTVYCWSPDGMRNKKHPSKLHKSCLCLRLIESRMSSIGVHANVNLDTKASTRGMSLSEKDGHSLNLVLTQVKMWVGRVWLGDTALNN